MKTKKQMSRRSFIKSAALGAIGLGAAACKPKAVEPAGPVEMDIWTGWTEQAAKNIEAILNGYNESQDRLTAHHVVVPESMTQKLLAAISAGDPPGAAIVFGANIAYTIAAQNGLLAMDEVGREEDLSALKGWMNPALWDLGVYEGKFYYASMWNQCYGVFVNLDIADKQGVDASKPPATLDELDELWDKLTIWDGDDIDVLGGDLTWAALAMGRHMGQWLEPDGKTLTANHPNNLKALKWVTDRWQRIGPQKIQDFNASLGGAGGRSAGQDPFLAGLTATVLTGPWKYNTIVNFAPEGFRYTVWPVPKPTGYTEQGMYTYGDGWIVPKGSKDPGAAWEIIGTMTGATGDKDVYTSLFTTWLCVNGPVSESMKDWPKFRDEVIGACPGYQEIFWQDLFHSDYYLYPPKIPTSSSYSSMMDAEWEKARLGQKTPEEALDFVQQEAQNELDDWLEQHG